MKVPAGMTMKKLLSFVAPTTAVFVHLSALAQGAAVDAAAAVASAASGPGTDRGPPIFTWVIIFVAGVAVGYALGSASAKGSNKQS